MLNTDLQHQNTAARVLKWSSNESQDAEEQAHRLTHWQQEYDQLSGGSFQGRLDELLLDQTHVFQEYTSQSLHQLCRISPGTIWLGIPLRQQPCRINGMLLPEQGIMCRSDADSFELLTPEAFDIYGLVVKCDELQKVACSQGIPLEPDGLSQQAMICLPATLLHQLRFMLALWLRHDTNAAATHLQQDFVLTLILDLLQQQQPAKASLPGLQHRRKVVQQAEAYVKAHPQRLVTITELCEQVHVSRRTLQYSFESVLGMSPLIYLRCIRLNQVHRALLAPVEGQTVLETAARWGFWHAGQFSRDYRRLFAETPSATLLRARCNRHE